MPTISMFISSINHFPDKIKNRPAFHWLSDFLCFTARNSIESVSKNTWLYAVVDVISIIGRSIIYLGNHEGADTREH